MYAASSLASNVRRKPLLVFFCDFWIAELARNFRDRTGNPVLLHLPKEVLRTLEVLHNQCARRVSIPQVTAYSVGNQTRECSYVLRGWRNWKFGIKDLI